MSKLVKCFCAYNTQVPVQQLLDLLTRQFPGAPFNKTISIEGALTQLQDVSLFIKDTIRHSGNIPLITNSGNKSIVELSGYAMQGHYAYGGKDVWYILIQIEDDVKPASPDIEFLEELATLLHAYWGIINDKSTETYAALQLQPVGFEMAMQLGLPRLMPPQGYPNPYIPSGLAWLNYWSPQTVEQLRVNENILKEQVYLVKQTSDAGLVFQLTQNVLSMQNAQHLQTLINMFNAYPDVGGRRIQP